MRYDPDGNPKRRAKNGEKRCGECRHKAWRGAHFHLLRDGVRRRIIGPCLGKPGDVLSCRADDYAGDCRHYEGVRQ